MLGIFYDMHFVETPEEALPLLTEDADIRPYLERIERARQQHTQPGVSASSA